jgi:phosphomannomutase
MKQPEPIASNLERLRKTVVEQKADVGIALDGDADRVGVVDENGRYLTTLDVFSLLTHHLLGRRKLTGGVASTLTMSSMVDSICREYSQPVYRTAVGFKFVGPVMVQNDCVLGGEESGGYAFRGHIPERDGALSGLFFLEAMAMSGRTPSQLMDEMHEITGPHVFRREDVEFEFSKREAIVKALESQGPSTLGGMRVEGEDRTDGVKFMLKDGAWAMARLSGTEPLARVYAEAPDEGTLDAVIRDTRAALGL